METKKYKKMDQNYFCKFCDYTTSVKCNFTKHCSTDKHKKLILGNQMETLEHTESINPSKFLCEICQNLYANKSGLWKHKKKCIKKYKESINEKTEILDLFKQQISENSEIKYFLMEQNKHLMEQNKQLMEQNNKQQITNNIVNGNINNNQFNLQLFLNETCKDAMSIDEFIKYIQPNIHDLEETGRLGYSAGITRIIVNGLKELDISKRPIHCSDLKRETMFVKNTDKWERETEKKPILLKAIKEIGKKNILNIKEWQKNHTNFNHYDSKQNDQYLQIVSNSMSGGTEEEQLANYEKIVRNIAKETFIDKK
jgi:hypothetical protein